MKNCLYIYWIMLLNAASFNLLAVPFNAGAGTKEQPFSIVDAQQLDAVRNYLGATAKDTYFRLDADIDLASFNGGYWVPIGKNGSESTFRGKFDGNGKKIFNLKIGKQGDFYRYTGLFGHISDGAEINNLSIESGIITGKPDGDNDTYTGAVAGYVSSNESPCLIKSCTNKATVAGGNSGGLGTACTGGICGYVSSGISSGTGYTSIISCLNMGNVTGQNGTGSRMTGGIAGQALASSVRSTPLLSIIVFSSILISECMNMGTITGGTAFSSTSATGGICGYYSGFGSGYNSSRSVAEANISHCINSGTIASGEQSGLSESYTGGITAYQSGCGSMYGTGAGNIKMCINNGTIICSDTNETACTGGISGFSAGFASSDATALTISQSYNHALVAFVNENNSTGGIAGEIMKNDKAGIKISENYWLKENDINNAIQGIGKKENSIVTGNDELMSLDAEQLTRRNNFKNWSFGETNQSPWEIWEETATPYLYFQSVPINVSLGNTNELIYTFMQGTIADSITVYRKSGKEYILFKSFKKDEYITYDWIKFGMDISEIYNGETLRLVSYQSGKLPSNPADILITNTTAGLEKVSKNAISVHPNPAGKGGEVIISGLQDENNYLMLFDISGKPLGNYESEGVEIRFPAPETAGIYMLQLTNKTGEKKCCKLMVK